MKKRIGLTVAVGLMASVPSLRAAVAACPTNTTVQALLDLGSTGCLVGDKLFGGFNTDLNNLSLATATLTATPGGTNPSFSWTIVPAGPTLQSSAFNFGFFVNEVPSLCPGTSCLITQTVSQMTAGIPSNPVVGVVTATINLSAGPSPVTLTNLLTNPILMAVTDISPGVAFLGMNASVIGGSVTGEGLHSLSFGVVETVVPEPVTFVLMGAGLLGLVLFHRWLRA